ncbi:hypothetical protein [Occultella aeris]|uniref:hypothetical protein n=1 Tax=Occultella aeris TaxID=2761496 RepID=UPI001E48E966|nr:hypothetical protein [Occultella aeris]
MLELMTTSKTRSPAHRSVPSAEHEHAWSTQSRHLTSSGHVIYVRCETCGVRRVDLQQRDDMPPAPLSMLLGVASGPAR